MLQNTISKKVCLDGIGLHTGQMVNMCLNPADKNTGIIFKRTDVTGAESIINAKYNNVTKTQLGTVIANKFNVEVSTIEHLMAALWGMQIDNAIIEIDNMEVPIMDGSSDPFINLIKQAGIKQQQAKRRYLKVKKDIKVKSGEAEVGLKPADSFKIDLGIDFADKAIDKQNITLDFANDNFINDLSKARTFGFKHEVDYLQSIGLARGGSLENAIVIDDGKVLNKGGLRFNDEFVRHKALDCVGDLYLSGKRILGEFIGHKSGHNTNNLVLREMFDTQDAFEEVEAAA